MSTKVFLNIIFLSILIPVSAQQCGTTSWSTLSGNAQRTSVSDGCIYGLQNLWSYQAVPPVGRIFYNTGAGNMVATNNEIYFRYSHYDTTGSTSGTKDKGAIDKLNLNGVKQWSYQSLGFNHDKHGWAALMDDNIYINDDYINKLNTTTGQPGGALGLDYWGEIIPDNGRIYTTNYYHIDGGGIWAGALTNNFQQIWIRNATGSTKGLNDQRRGKIALDNNILFYAPKYNTAWAYTSGIYAFVASGTTQGTLLWHKPCTPTAPISSGYNKVFSFEDNNIVCRSQSNGNVVWQQALTGALVVNQSPVLVNNLCIVATSTGVFAFNESNGNLVWQNLITGIPIGSNTQSAAAAPETTVMAAASGSNTLVVTSNDGIYVLLLNNGSTLWSGIPSLIPSGNRACNPVIVGDRLYVTIPYYASSGQIYHTKLIALKSTAAPLPIGIDLSLQEVNNTIKLQWNTTETGIFNILLDGVVIASTTDKSIVLPPRKGSYQIKLNSFVSNTKYYKGKSEVIVYPSNVVTGSFSFITSAAVQRVIIYDIVGRKVAEYNRVNNLEIPVSGYYTCVLMSEGEVVSRIRVIKK